MSERTAYFNGHFISESELRLAPSDVGVRLGEFVFETIRTYDLRPHRLRDHLDRLYASMKALDIDCGMSIEEMEEVNHEFLEAQQGPPSRPHDDLMWHVDCSRGIAKPFDLGTVRFLRADRVHGHDPAGTVAGRVAIRAGERSSGGHTAYQEHPGSLPRSEDEELATASTTGGA